MSIASEESMSKALDECGTKSGDEGIGFREVICHTCNIVASEVAGGPIKGPFIGVFHACGGGAWEDAIVNQVREGVQGVLPGQRTWVIFHWKKAADARGAGKVGHPIGPGEAVGRLEEVERGGAERGM